jgi:hypothetical protein
VTERKITSFEIVRALLLDRYGTVDPSMLAAAGASDREIAAAQKLTQHGSALAPEPTGLAPLIEGDRYMRRRAARG